MPRQAINWERIRERWIERHLAGETYTLKQLARDESVKYDTLKKRARRQDWRGQLRGRQVRINAQVAEQVEIDQVKTRLELVRMGERTERLFLAQVQRWGDWAENHPDERVSLREMVTLGNLVLKLKEKGAGLPKEHNVVRHDEADDPVSVGRREMAKLEDTVVELARWKRDRRKEAEAKKAAEEKGKRAASSPAAERPAALGPSSTPTNEIDA